MPLIKRHVNTAVVIFFTLGCVIHPLFDRCLVYPLEHYFFMFMQKALQNAKP